MYNVSNSNSVNHEMNYCTLIFYFHCFKLFFVKENAQIYYNYYDYRQYSTQIPCVDVFDISNIFAIPQQGQ